MTFSIGSVQGGTRAGWRRVRPTGQAWQCGCTSDAKRPGYLVTCHHCKERRPS